MVWICFPTAADAAADASCGGGRGGTANVDTTCTDDAAAATTTVAMAHFNKSPLNSVCQHCLAIRPQVLSFALTFMVICLRLLASRPIEKKICNKSRPLDESLIVFPSSFSFCLLLSQILFQVSFFFVKNILFYKRNKGIGGTRVPELR